MNDALQKCVTGGPFSHKVFDEVKSEYLPVVVCNDPDGDDTAFDFTCDEFVTITQTAEDGTVHTIVLSAVQLAQASPYMKRWKLQNTPPAYQQPETAKN